MILLITVLLNAIILEAAYTVNKNWYWALAVSMPLLLLTLYKCQKRPAIFRNSRIFGHLRYSFKSLRPERRRYFSATNLDGEPVKRREHFIIYRCADNDKQTTASVKPGAGRSNRAQGNQANNDRR